MDDGSQVRHAPALAGSTATWLRDEEACQRQRIERERRAAVSHRTSLTPHPAKRKVDLGACRLTPA